MQLRIARVCLDCEEVHDAAQCPACASESFAFLSRWVPSAERRSKARPEAQPKTISPRTTQKVLLGAGILGGAAYFLNRWLSAARRKLEAAAERQDTGELR
jgi:hypothetical protein